jgi:hypothetical protein
LKKWIHKQPKFAPSAAEAFAIWLRDQPEFAPAFAAKRLEHEQVVKAANHCALLSLMALFTNQIIYNESIVKARQRGPKPHVADTVVMANLYPVLKFALSNQRLTTSLWQRVSEKFLDIYWPDRPHPRYPQKRRTPPTRMVFDRVRKEIDTKRIRPKK